MREKTQDEKALSGTKRLDREKRSKVVTVKEIPRPQKYLNRRAKNIYKEICLYLLKHNALCMIDSHYISQAAYSMDLFEQMAEKVANDGPIQIFKTGAENHSAAYTIMKKEEASVEKFCRNLGLNLRSRDAILAFAKSASAEEKKDPLQQMLERRLG